MTSTKLATVLLILLAILLDRVENKSLYGIGSRYTGDQLLSKDVLEARSNGLNENPSLRFTYAIPEPITYIEIYSEQNVYADVNFSWENDLVSGSVTAMNASDNARSFEVLIQIFGFNETMKELVNPRAILNRDIAFEGLLEPYEDYDEDEDDDDDDDEDIKDVVDDDEEFDFTSENSLESNLTQNRNKTDEDYDNDEDADFEKFDKIIEIGQRQKDDSLLYETFQTSKSNQNLTSQSVVFYYIDSNFITYVKFIIFDHYVDEPNDDYKAPVGEYSHFSPNTLKAIITDFKTNTVFIQMLIFGYKPTDLPVGYKPFLSKSQFNGGNNDNGDRITESPPMSPMHRLRMLMRAQENQGTTETAQAEPAGDELQKIVANNVVCVEKLSNNDRNGAASPHLSFELASAVTLGSTIVSLFALAGRWQL